jgi:hypothetical protein
MKATAEHAFEDASISSALSNDGGQILASLPNDLSRLIYLTSIRDYNSGTYRHQVLSQQYGEASAHSFFEACHQQIFSRLLANPIAKYVQEIEDYLRYSRAERRSFLDTWNSLQAYRAAVPLKAPKRACEAFFLNIRTALLVVENLRQKQTDRSEGEGHL